MERQSHRRDYREELRPGTVAINNYGTAAASHNVRGADTQNIQNGNPPVLVVQDKRHHRFPLLPSQVQISFLWDFSDHAQLG